MNNLTKLSSNSVLRIDNGNKDYRARVNIYTDWMDTEQRNWYDIDLATYRDFLLETRSPITAKIYLSAVRRRYEEILRNNNLWNGLYAHAVQSGSTKADANADIERLRTSIANAIHPSTAPVKVVSKRDIADSEKGIWLTKSQARSLLESPGTDTLRGLRDTAIIATMLCLALRESEVAALRVEDLRQSLNESLALRVSEGKGSVQRLIPYGEMEWVLELIERWMVTSGVLEGNVFRGFWKGCKRVRPTGLNAQAGSIDLILANYPVRIKGVITTVKPHDCRRTAITAWYNSGMGMKEIADNAGHANIKTTQIYIKSSSKERELPDVYDFKPLGDDE